MCIQIVIEKGQQTKTKLNTYTCVYIYMYIYVYTYVYFFCIHIHVWLVALLRQPARMLRMESLERPSSGLLLGIGLDGTSSTFWGLGPQTANVKPYSPVTRLPLNPKPETLNPKP